MEQEKKCIITITRQFGSLGRPIAKLVSEKLNIQYYDRDIMRMKPFLVAFSAFSSN